MKKVLFFVVKNGLSRFDLLLLQHLGIDSARKGIRNVNPLISWPHRGKIERRLTRTFIASRSFGGSVLICSDVSANTCCNIACTSKRYIYYESIQEISRTNYYDLPFVGDPYSPVD